MKRASEVRGLDVRTGKGVRLRLKDGRVDRVSGAKVPGKVWVGPGLVDLQVNGFGGMDFNTPPIAEDLPGRVARALWKEGVTTYFPTVITNAPDVIESCMRALARACDRDPDAASSAGSFHLEGPFISPEDGVRGAHDKAFTTAPDWDAFRRWQDAAGGRIRIVTLSPEWPGTSAFVEKCVEADVTVSIGHTAATPDQIREAVAAGASMSTHLGNGSHRMIPRHFNYIWEQLAQDSLAGCFIADGFHLPDAIIKVVIRTKGRRAIVVSDCTYLAGMEPGDYETHVGGKVTLTPEGKLHLTGAPDMLAGSAQSMAHGVDHLLRAGMGELSEIWEMGSIRPSKEMKLPGRRGLVKGAPADLVLFDREGGGMRVRETWKAGRKVYDRKRG